MLPRSRRSLRAPQVKFERYDEASDKIRTASLLPRQIRECENRIAWLKAQEATFASNKEARKIREAVLAVCKESNVLAPEQNARLESEFDSADGEGLSLAIAQQEQALAGFRADLAKADKSKLVSEDDAEKMAVFAPVESTITLEVAQHLGDNRVRTISLGPTDGFSRGLEVVDTGAPITVRVVLLLVVLLSWRYHILTNRRPDLLLRCAVRCAVRRCPWDRRRSAASST